MSISGGSKPVLTGPLLFLWKRRYHISYMYYILNTKCTLVEGGLDMLDSMDRLEIKYELFSSLAICVVSGEAVHSFY